MSRITIVRVEDIARANRIFSGLACDAERLEKLGGCYSSYCYYPSLAEQLASIVLALLKDHYFVDGNKRTALLVYLLLSRLNGLPHIEDTAEQARLFIGLAASHDDVRGCAKALYPNLYR